MKASKVYFSGTGSDISNYGFGISMKVVKERYSFLGIDNIGDADVMKIFSHLINTTPTEADALAEAFNNSGISFRNWRGTEKEDRVILTAIDFDGNYQSLIILK